MPTVHLVPNFDINVLLTFFGKDVIVNSQVYLAADLGASSGRVVAGVFDGRTVKLDDVHRFENGGILAADRMHWDVLGLWKQIQDGCRIAHQKYASNIRSIGVDTWGVDFGLLSRDDQILGNPFHYRDSHTNDIMEYAFERVSRDDIFEETGLQFMPFNSLFQLLAMKRDNSSVLENAHSLLMMPDLFNWLLTGEKVNEFTDATTTQFYNPKTNTWATSLLDRFDLPTSILGTIGQPGQSLGNLRSHVAEATGLQGVQVVLPGTHDTASAVMAVPAASKPGAKPDWCYISSGTWSLMGLEVPDPIINGACADYNFTNEGGVGSTVRLLKNIAGLWIVQQCRRVWNEQGRNYEWDDLVRMADRSRPLQSLIDPDHSSLVAPSDMHKAIVDYCTQAGQPVPSDHGAVIRCALESLALRYRSVLGWLEELNEARIDTIHIVGGGTQNRLLCQMTADACNRSVVAGPVEATALGNVMMQAVAAGGVASIAQARQVVRDSFDVTTYEPKDTAPWDDAFARFMKLP